MEKRIINFEMDYDFGGQPSEPVGGVKGAEELPQIIRFLLGECEFNGVWYGSGKPNWEDGEFWWRKYLRKYIEGQFQQPQVDEKQNSDDAYNEEMKQVHNSAIDEAMNKIDEICPSFVYEVVEKQIYPELEKLKKA